MNKIYFGSISLEKNRWAPGRIPSYKVSEYAQRAVNDGFAGVELWENHYLLADDTEKEKLISSDIKYIFNSYLTLAEGMTDKLKSVADAIKTLGAVAVKYNFAHIDYGVDKKTLMAQRETLMRFADMLPADVKLLCECHGWTAMEVPERAAQVFSTLDERFGAIVHLGADFELLKSSFECYGERICHIHTAANHPERGFVHLCEMSDVMERNMNFILSKGYNGTFTTEFIKDSDNMETYYENALIDKKYIDSIVYKL